MFRFFRNASRERSNECQEIVAAVERLIDDLVRIGYQRGEVLYMVQSHAGTAKVRSLDADQLTSLQAVLEEQLDIARRSIAFVVGDK